MLNKKGLVSNDSTPSSPKWGRAEWSQTLRKTLLYHFPDTKIHVYKKGRKVQDHRLSWKRTETPQLKKKKKQQTSFDHTNESNFSVSLKKHKLLSVQGKGRVEMKQEYKAKVQTTTLDLFFFWIFINQHKKGTTTNTIYTQTSLPRKHATDKEGPFWLGRAK